MRIIRYLDPDQNTRFGIESADGQVNVAEGDPYDGLSDTGVKASVTKILTPIVPKAILCIGLNYAEHAKRGPRFARAAGSLYENAVGS